MLKENDFMLHLWEEPVLWTHNWEDEDAGFEPTTAARQSESLPAKEKVNLIEKNKSSWYEEEKTFSEFLCRVRISFCVTTSWRDIWEWTECWKWWVRGGAGEWKGGGGAKKNSWKWLYDRILKLVMKKKKKKKCFWPSKSENSLPTSSRTQTSHFYCFQRFKLEKVGGEGWAGANENKNRLEIAASTLSHYTHSHALSHVLFHSWTNKTKNTHKPTHKQIDKNKHPHTDKHNQRGMEKERERELRF